MGDGDANYTWCALSSPQRIGKGIGTMEIWKKNQDPSDCRIVEIGQNTEKSHGDLLSLRLRGKGCKNVDDNNNNNNIPDDCNDNKVKNLEVSGWVETIQMTAFQRTARILRRLLEI